jgi:hypothetical protein
MGALLLLAFSRDLPSSTDLVQARRIQLVDHAGQVRIDLRHDTTETGLFVLSDTENPQPVFRPVTKLRRISESRCDHE